MNTSSAIEQFSWHRQFPPKGKRGLGNQVSVVEENLREKVAPSVVDQLRESFENELVDLLAEKVINYLSLSSPLAMKGHRLTEGEVAKIQQLLNRPKLGEGFFIRLKHEERSFSITNYKELLLFLAWFHDTFILGIEKGDSPMVPRIQTILEQTS